MFKNSYFRIALFSLMLCGALVSAGGIKTWASGDTISVADINANFQHIHNAMVGGHGARLVNADVSATANIGYTKIQNGRGIIRAWATLASGACATPATCTITESLNITSVEGTASTGVYDVTLAYTATDTSYAVSASPCSGTGCTATNIACVGVAASTTHATVTCYAHDGTTIDANFSFYILDGD